MTSRNSSPFLIAATLLLGIVVGIAVDRGAFLSAQSAKPRQTDGVPVRNTTQASGQDAVFEQLARQYEQFHHVNRTFEMVARAIAPSVVHIVAEKTGGGTGKKSRTRYEETGSGVIVRSEAAKGLYVLTNNHVVVNASAAKITISLQDGRTLRPQRYWLDAKADIAVLSLGRDDLPAARFGDSDEMTVGQWVLALGSPYGLTHSVSQGIISAQGRHLDELSDVENQDFLQTDAAINPGNSGGPLVNMKGQVIGINNSIASQNGGNDGVGFSIPSNLARWIMNELIAHGEVRRGGLGVDLHTEFLQEDAQSMGMERARGAWVVKVHPNSGAAEGGVRGGDVILKYKGVEVHDLNHLINMVSMTPIGQSAEILVWRDRKSIPMTVKIGARTEPAAAPSVESEISAGRGLLRRPNRPAEGPSIALGLEFATLNEETRRALKLPEPSRGAAITKVTPDSPLAAFLKPQDVITSIDGQAIRTAEEAAKVLNDHAARDPLVIGFDRVAAGVVERRSVRIP